ncbi:MAG TPA: tripartite tricarboxylate transporter permease [Candidatus Nanoarchaeia archaeon]|nr:tripartite tricarboxylate transporter permease [Candidatus Nanoarchaeia archaeon]
MIEQIILAIIIGCILGTITGITPGVHINLVSALIFALSSILLNYTQPIILVIAITSMAITHTFLDIIPTTFLGAPNADDVLTALPAHKLLLEGKGGEAIRLAIIGSFLGLVSSIILTPFIIHLVELSYPIIKNYIATVLICISAYIIWKSKSRTLAFMLFALTGILGLAVFNMKTLEQPLFPLLSGLFGVSSLIISLKSKTTIPKQIEIDKIIIDKIRLAKNTIISLISSILTSFLPGLTSSHTTIIASTISKTKDPKEYLIINNSINTTSMILSFIALFSIDKARNGAVVVISNFINNFTKIHLILLLATALTASFIAIILALKLNSLFCKYIEKINYSKLCLGIIIFLVFIVSILTGYLGLIVLITASSIGIIPKLLNIENTHLMGCLIVPVILYYVL